MYSIHAAQEEKWSIFEVTMKLMTHITLDQNHSLSFKDRQQHRQHAQQQYDGDQVIPKHNFYAPVTPSLEHV